MTTPSSSPRIAAAIRDKALALGFDAVGFAPAALGPAARDRLHAFLAAGQHGEMDWLADRAGPRSHPQALWPEAMRRSLRSLCWMLAIKAPPILARPRRPRRPKVIPAPAPATKPPPRRKRPASAPSPLAGRAIAFG